MRIVLATRNEGKAAELRRLLAVDGIEFATAGELRLPDTEETGSTLRENAVLKAVSAADASWLPALADDTGLEIHALGGWPGVRSARCAGGWADDAERRAFVLGRMDDAQDRRARFVTVMAFARPLMSPAGALGAAEPTFFTGACEGLITRRPIGICKPGLPYDSIFHALGLGKTFASATEDEKAAVSHRGDAARQMRKYLEFIASKQ